MLQKRADFKSIKIKVHSKKDKKYTKMLNSGHLYILRLWLTSFLLFYIF